MKLFNTEQIKRWDEATIQNEPITSLALMERASLVFTKWFTNQFPDTSMPIYIFCGNGNNGGDGLAISRLLYDRAYTVHVFVFSPDDRKSEDYLANLEALKSKTD